VATHHAPPRTSAAASCIGELVAGQTRGSRFGRSLGANRETAYLSGINVQRNLILIYVLSAMFAALGGFMLLGYSGAASISLADDYQLISIVAVVIGGTTLAGGVAGYRGTAMGAVVLQALNSLLIALNIAAAGRQVGVGGTLPREVAAMALEPDLVGAVIFALIPRERWVDRVEPVDTHLGGLQHETAGPSPVEQTPVQPRFRKRDAPTP
jgi:ABC-type branched-subunit amino acid transport system permease subunit